MAQQFSSEKSQTFLGNQTEEPKRTWKILLEWKGEEREVETQENGEEPYFTAIFWRQ